MLVMCTVQPLILHFRSVQYSIFNVVLRTNAKFSGLKLELNINHNRLQVDLGQHTHTNVASTSSLSLVCNIGLRLHPATNVLDLPWNLSTGQSWNIAT